MEYEDYGKKMLIYASVAIVGIFFALQALFGFPLFKSFESDIKSDARVVIKDASGTCILEASDKIPRVIHNCPYDKEDIVTITVQEGFARYKRTQSKIINLNFDIVRAIITISSNTLIFAAENAFTLV